MYTIIYCLIIAALFYVVGSGIAYTLIRSRITTAHSTTSDLLTINTCATGLTGCSVICCKVTDLKQIEHLLSTEHDLYEVIVVIDTLCDGEFFSQIRHHFKLIRVNAPDTHELDHTPIRALYRSKLRCFRRLVLLDKEQTTTYDDLDAATSIASYDYLLPLPHNALLRQGSIESIITQLNDYHDRGFDMMMSADGECCIVRRDAIIEAHGFSPHTLRTIPYNRRLTTHALLLRPTSQCCGRHRAYGVITLVVLLLITLWFWGTPLGITTLSALLATLALARHSALLDSEKCSFRDTLYHIGRTIRLFYMPKFFI